MRLFTSALLWIAPFVLVLPALSGQLPSGPRFVFGMVGLLLAALRATARVVQVEAASPGLLSISWLGHHEDLIRSNIMLSVGQKEQDIGPSITWIVTKRPMLGGGHVMVCPDTSGEVPRFAWRKR